MTLKTEDEARKCWCPFARVATYDKHAHEFAAGVTVGMCAANKTSDGDVRKGAHCIASECMAWRWGPSNKTKIQAIKERREATGESLAAAKEWVEAHTSEWNDANRGYCGLAGKP